VLAEWSGSQRGRFIAPASATFCPESGILELVAVRGDTGVGLALYPGDFNQPVAGSYPVFGSAMPEPPRPGSGAALRWFSGIDLAAFEAASGTVELNPADTLLSGTFALRMQQPTGTDTLVMNGRFSAVPLHRLEAGCSRTSRRNLR
jgi:hypothetical protein